MTPEEQEVMYKLCKLVATEKDPIKFDEYLRQLNEVLDAKQVRIRIAPEPKPN
jgi:hypothetical protein